MTTNRTPLDNWNPRIQSRSELLNQMGGKKDHYHKMNELVHENNSQEKWNKKIQYEKQLELIDNVCVGFYCMVFCRKNIWWNIELGTLIFNCALFVGIFLSWSITQSVKSQPSQVSIIKGPKAQKLRWHGSKFEI